MRIAVDHLFTIDLDFSAPRIELALRVTPEDNHDQTVSGWRIGPDRDARLRVGRDGFGNVLTMLYAEGPLERMDIHVAGEVFTGPSSGILSAAHPEPLPPALFLRPAPAGEAPDLAAHAIEAMGKAEGAIDRLHLLNVALFQRAAEVEEGPLAATFVTAARRLQFPARCVSGYLTNGDGGSVPHFWAEAFVDTIGWVGFDPATGLSAGEDHARVASALDLAGVAAITGGSA
jgi:hypothetical protein